MGPPGPDDARFGMSSAESWQGSDTTWRGPASAALPSLRFWGLEGQMVHDDDTTPPDTNDITTAQMAGDADAPDPTIYRLIVSVARTHPGFGAGRIQEVLREDHSENVRLESVVYVLNELRKATDRSGGSR